MGRVDAVCMITQDQVQMQQQTIFAIEKNEIDESSCKMVNATTSLSSCSISLSFFLYSRSGRLRPQPPFRPSPPRRLGLPPVLRAPRSCKLPWDGPQCRAASFSGVSGSAPRAPRARPARPARGAFVLAAPLDAAAGWSRLRCCGSWSRNDHRAFTCCAAPHRERRCAGRSFTQTGRWGGVGPGHGAAGRGAASVHFQ